MIYLFGMICFMLGVFFGFFVTLGLAYAVLGHLLENDKPNPQGIRNPP